MYVVCADESLPTCVCVYGGGGGGGGNDWR